MGKWKTDYNKTRKYKKSWEETFPWLTLVNDKCFCRICHAYFSSFKKHNIIAHEKSKKHRKIEQEQGPILKSGNFLKQQPTEELEEAIADSINFYSNSLPQSPACDLNSTSISDVQNSLIEGVCCNLCSKRFNDSDLLPKLLDCGHTICLLCLDNLLSQVEENTSFQTQALCCECNTILKKENSSQYATNHAILTIIKSIGNLLVNDKQKFKTESIAPLKEVITQKMDDYAGLLATLRRGVDVLTALEDLPTGEMNIESATKTIDEWKTTVEEIDPRLCCDVSDDISVSAVLKEPHTEEYIDEILGEIRCKVEQNTYAIQRLNNTIHRGIISLYDIYMLVHCLERCQSVEKGTTKLWFQDIIRCSKVNNLITFMDIRCDNLENPCRVLIEVTDLNYGTQFLRLCSGELGVSYKNGIVMIRGTGQTGSENATVLSVSGYVKDGKMEKGQIDYFVDGNSFVTFSDQLLVRGDRNGSFHISSASKNSSSTNVFGKVVSPPDFVNIMNFGKVDKSPKRLISRRLRIVDCGIAIKV